MKYQVLVGCSIEELEENVNFAIKVGAKIGEYWKLQGGVSVAAVVTHDTDKNEWTEYTYAQAMILEE